MRIGYDLDGVICMEENGLGEIVSKLFKLDIFLRNSSLYSIKYLNGLFSIPSKVGIKLRDKQPIFKYPSYKGAIITSRPQSDFQATWNWLVRNDIPFDTLYMPERVLTPMEHVYFKNDSIIKENLDVYIESHEFFARQLKLLSSHKCKILTMDNIESKEFFV